MNKEKNKVDFRKNLGIYIALAKPYKAFFIGTAFFVFLVAFAKVFERYLFKELIDQGTLLTAGSITQETFFVMVGSMEILDYGFTVFGHVGSLV